MFTDMVGFTHGAQLDERGTLGRLAEQEALVRPLVDDHQGRVVKSTGDGLLVEFPSALKATECAMTIQSRLHDRNLRAAGAPIELRIGIHLGDVEQRGEDILGDAVNLAARVQPTADAGGIAISQQVYDQVRNKVTARFEPLTPRSLKGVEVPVTIFRVLLPWQAAGPGTPTAPSRSGRLAVLPFSNISPDPKDAYFSDGLTEEVISVLSELPDLRVIARASADHYRSSSKPVAEVAAELGVQWVLVGSVRKDGSRLRFTAQLVESSSQDQIWAGKYDRELTDVFAIQSELARQVADALQLKLIGGAAQRIEGRRTPSPESYLEYLQGRASLRDLSRENLMNAKAHFERAIELDERNAPAVAGLAESIDFLAQVYETDSRARSKAEARRLAARALEMNPDLAEPRTIVASNMADDYEYGRAEAELRRAIQNNPSYSGAHLYLGAILADVGRPEEALAEYAIAEQLDPLSALTLAESVSLLVYLRRLDEARTKLRRLGEVENEGMLFQDRRGLLALTEGDLDEYLAGVHWFEPRFPGRPEFSVAYAVYELELKHTERARARIADAEAAPVTVRPASGIADFYARLGDLDRCFEWLNRAIDDRRFAPRSWLYEPSKEGVRRDPRWSQIRQRIHLD